MFRHFSFESASLHPSFTCIEDQRAAMNVSPTSVPIASCPPHMSTRLPTPPPCSLGELAQRFHRHNLRVEVPQPSRNLSFYDPPTPPSESEDSTFPVESNQSYPRTTSQSVSSFNLRAKRQANTRLQCSPTHIRDISLLVERMIEANDQCSVQRVDGSTQIACSPATDTADDEGVSMDYTPPESPQEPLHLGLKYRRSGERLNGQACVAKNVRMRKKPCKIRKVTASK